MLIGGASPNAGLAQQAVNWIPGKTGERIRGIGDRVKGLIPDWVNPLLNYATPQLFKEVYAPKWAQGMRSSGVGVLDPMSMAGQYGYYGNLPSSQQLYGGVPQINPQILRSMYT